MQRLLVEINSQYTCKYIMGKINIRSICIHVYIKINIEECCLYTYNKQMINYCLFKWSLNLTWLGHDLCLARLCAFRKGNHDKIYMRFIIILNMLKSHKLGGFWNSALPYNMIITPVQNFRMIWIQEKTAAQDESLWDLWWLNLDEIAQLLWNPYTLWNT